MHPTQWAASVNNSVIFLTVMDYFDGVPSVAGGLNSNSEALNSIEVMRDNTWIENPQDVTLNTERNKFIKIYVSKYLVMFPN